MRTEQEIRERIEKLNQMIANLSWWDEEKQYMETEADVLRWVLGEAPAPYIGEDEEEDEE